MDAAADPVTRYSVTHVRNSSLWRAAGAMSADFSDGPAAAMRMSAASTRTRDLILDAALATALDVGFRRTTLTGVAQRAGVSRMTAYRHFDDHDALMRALMRREFGKSLATIETAVDAMAPTSATQRLVSLSSAAVREIGSHPLLRKGLESDPDLLMPYIVEHLGSTQRFADTLLQGLLHDAQTSGSGTFTDPRATSMLILLTSSVLIWSSKILENEGLSEAVLTEWQRVLPLILGNGIVGKAS